MSQQGTSSLLVHKPNLTHSDDGMERKRHMIDYSRCFVYVGVRRKLLELLAKFYFLFNLLYEVHRLQSPFFVRS